MLGGECPKHHSDEAEEGANKVAHLSEQAAGVEFSPPVYLCPRMAPKTEPRMGGGMVGRMQGVGRQSPLTLPQAEPQLGPQQITATEGDGQCNPMLLVMSILHHSIDATG